MKLKRIVWNKSSSMIIFAPLRNGSDHAADAQTSSPC